MPATPANADPNLPTQEHPTQFTGQSDTPQATFEIGERLGRALLHHSRGAILALQGDLGAGKTTLAQGIARGLGISATVTSPTFTFINEYTVAHPGGNRLRLFHIDLYRLPATSQAAAEAGTFGLDEILDEAVAPNSDTLVILEWAERITNLLPPDHLHITLRATDDHADDPAAYTDAPQQRTLHMHAHGPHSRALLHALLSDPSAGK